MGINEIINLNTKEKIILMNEIWESLDKQQDNISTPKWHKEVLKIRIDKIKNGQAKIISSEELRNLNS